MNRPDFTVADLGELASLHTAEIAEGANVWVESDGAYWTLEKNSGAAPGPTVVVPLAGAPQAGATNARWIQTSGAAVNHATFIYREGAVAPTAPVYATFAEALAAAQAYAGPSLIFFDNSLGSPEIVAPVSDISNVRLVANPGVQVAVLDGATLVSTETIYIEGAQLRSFSSLPVIAQPNTFVIALYGGGILLDNAATAPFILVGAGEQATVGLENVGLMAGHPRPFLPAMPALQVDVGGSATVYLAAGANLGIGAVGGVGPCTLNVLSTSVTITLPLGPGVNVSYATNPTKLGYTPAILADWSGIPPVNVQNALDRIAAALGPIP